MKKFLNLLVLLSFQIGYLSWGTGKSLFVFQAEALLINKAMTNPFAVLHPFIVIPFLGQLLLIITLFQKKPSKAMTIIGVTCSGLLMLMLLFIGVAVPNFNILISALPFVTFGVLLLRIHKKQVI
jgi:hypothetical protein